MDNVAIAFLTPTDKDKFTEEIIGEDLFKVTMDGSYLIVKITKGNQGGVDLKFTDSKFTSEYYSKKLMGYVLFKIVSRYK
jgi:hypothetical protein